MTTPTITTTGTNNGLLLITDHTGVAHRVPKTSLNDVVNSGNGHAYRVEIYHGSEYFVLLFASTAEVNTFLAAVDALY